MLHIKLKGMEHSLSLHTLSTCGLGVNVKKSECAHAAYQIKGKEVYINKEKKNNFDPAHTPHVER